MSIRLIGTLFLVFWSASCLSVEPITTAQFDEWMEEVSNWGRWGKEDELGTLNLITPEQRKAAAKLVEDGVSVSLSLPLNKVKDELNALPFEHTLKVEVFGGQKVSGDRYSIEYHGASHSHMDGLPHVLTGGKMYNGFPITDLQPEGALHLGIQNVHQGIFSRGLLVDMPLLEGVDFLAPGRSVTIRDLEKWEMKTGIRVGQGDVLLLRTGRWEAARQSGSNANLASAPGFHASVAVWLRQRDVAAIGSDVVADVLPSGMKDRAIPLHELALAGMGMPIFDNLDLGEASREAIQRGRWEFLFVAAPLRIPGGTGSPLNPLAVF